MLIMFEKLCFLQLLFNFLFEYYIQIHAEMNYKISDIKLQLNFLRYCKQSL